MAKATLIIEDSEQEGCVNIHWTFEPTLDEGSSAHGLMARVLQHADQLIKQEAGENIIAGVRNEQDQDSAGS